MSLEKLTIYYSKRNKLDSFPVVFNPTQLVFSKDVTWRSNSSKDAKSAQGTMRFSRVNPETLSIKLYFDVYEEAARYQAAPWLYIPFGLKCPNVLAETQKISKLARVDIELHRPPVCDLRWGKQTLFMGVVTHVAQTITLFMSDGTPVRAEVDCTFQEYFRDSDKLRDELHSPDVDKTHVVQAGDTLNRIAHELYDNQALWRVIAEANGIDDPRRLTPGQVLRIPKLT